MESYLFPCGCEFDIIGPPPIDGALPCLNFDDDNPPLCSAAWDIIGKGDTKGIFQLDSSLGKHWSKRVKPRDYEEMSALASLLRPGCINSKDERGVSMTENYCRRKHKEEDVKPFHPLVDSILSSTVGVLTYQEQHMYLGRDIAGFDLKEVEMLRRSIAKKKQEELAKVKKLFLKKTSEKKVVSEEQAQMLWGWIEKSGRYAFCKGHSMPYGMTGYESAYIKAHFPTAFYYGWLRYAYDLSKPLDEIQELVNDARIHDVPIEPPDLRTKAIHFYTDGLRVVFGIADIKGLGETTIKKFLSVLVDVEKATKPLDKMTWLEFLVLVSPQMGESVLAKLIRVGALRWLNIPRKKMLHELTLFDQLTVKEKEWCKEKIANAPEILSLPELFLQAGHVKKEGGAAANKNRVVIIESLLKLLKNPPSGLRDSPAEIAANEAALLGIAVTCSSVDACDASDANCTCKDYLGGRSGSLFLAVKIEDFRVIKTKKGENPGQEMAFLTVSDSSGFLNDVVIFPEPWGEYRELLSKDNSVLLQGERDKLKGAFRVNEVWQLREVL